MECKENFYPLICANPRKSKAITLDFVSKNQNVTTHSARCRIAKQNLWPRPGSSRATYRQAAREQDRSSDVSKLNRYLVMAIPAVGLSIHQGGRLCAQRIGRLSFAEIGED